ncbi:MAG: response regulator [Myxococcales bacterium]|nr:response regulator [Myxococcales bacterium]
MPATILIVEDEADLVPALEYAFRREGFRTVAVASGQSALALVEAGGIDLVLLDFMLPDLQGTEICRRLRARERTRQLPVIMMTARAEADDVRAGYAAGVDDYVIKPFRVQDLVVRVRAALGRRVTPTKPAPPVMSASLG